jgi:hypothetical protein
MENLFLSGFPFEGKSNFLMNFKGDDLLNVAISSRFFLTSEFPEQVGFMKYLEWL